MRRMLLLLLISGSLTAGCSLIQAENPGITVEVTGLDVDTDARILQAEVNKACDNVLHPRGVNVTVKFLNSGDVEHITVDCDDGDVHEK